MDELPLPASPEYPVPQGSLVLASGSPRRKALLRDLGLDFEVRPANIEELPQPGETPSEMTIRLAREKAWAIARTILDGPRRFVLGSDTLVVLDGLPMGKPTDSDDAVAMLMRLTGHTHTVITGVAVIDSNSQAVFDRTVESHVRMRLASEEEIQAYVKTGESLDKAGAYALQGEGRRFVSEVMGSESNVIGLPLSETWELLARAARSSQIQGDSHGREIE